MKNWIKLALFVVIVAALIYFARAYNLDQQFANMKTWVQAQGSIAPLIYTGIFALATILALPASVLTLMAAPLFGVPMGIFCVLVGANLGACICFLIAKYFARNTVKGILDKNEKFKKLEDLTEKNGYMIVAITRLVPIFPFNLLNYGFGLTNIPFKVYALWTAVCIMPGTVLYVSGIGAITYALEHGEVPWSLVIVVASILTIITVVVKRAKATLKQ